MKTTILTLLPAALLLFSSCKKDKWPCVRSNKNITEETRTVSNFDGINVLTSAEVFITQDTTLTENEVLLVAPENIIDLITTKVLANELRIDNERCINGTSDIKIYITTNDLNSIALTGSGEVVSENAIFTQKMELDISGSGEADLDIHAEELTCDISGSGKASLQGETNKLDVDISGSGSVKAYSLIAEDVNVSISGSGKAEVHANGRLDISISGSGSVLYRGQPDLHQTVTGSGNIDNDN